MREVTKQQQFIIQFTLIMTKNPNVNLELLEAVYKETRDIYGLVDNDFIDREKERPMIYKNVLKDK